MTHYDDIEEFKDGGRISPSQSATQPPKGTLGVGINGNVWINVEDKNGRLSWKPTDITTDNFSLIDFSDFTDSRFLFYSDKNGYFFKLYYNYDVANCIIQLQDVEHPETFKGFDGDLNECNSWFEDNFSVKDYNTLTSTGDGIIFQANVRQLFGMLRYLITNKGLRSIKAPNPDEAPKFKIGDKVKLPNTKSGQKLVGGMSNVYDDAKNNGQDYLVVTEVWDNTIMLDTELSKYGDYFSQELDKLELYQEMPEPKFKIGDKVKRIDGEQVMTVVKQIYDTTKKEWDYDLVFVENGNANSLFESYLELYYAPFQQIDFLKPSTEELDILIKAMQNYSDGLTFLSNRVANVKIKTKTGADFEIVAIFDPQARSVIELLETTTKKDIVSNKITNESLIEISEIYVNLLSQLIEQAEGKTPPKDCEADPNKIISGQVKKFYDLNKTRIEKLDSKFSCKIVQALVSLSEYESCGSPSSVTLPKAKSDLLSRISNLKV
jgi:hypothetical protein